MGLVGLCVVAVWAAGCDDDDDDDAGTGGSSGSAGTSAGVNGGGSPPIAGSPHGGSSAAGDTPGGAAGSDTGGASAGAGDEAGAGGEPTGGVGGEAGAGSAAGAGGEAGIGGAASGCGDDEFAVVGESPSCVTCGTYHYETYAPDHYDVCEVFGTGHYVDAEHGKLYLEAKSGFPEPSAWTVLRNGGETSDLMHLVANFPDEPPACASASFALQLSVDGKYLVADVSAALACASTSSVPLIGQFSMGSLSYGCAGTVTTRIAIDFGINATPSTVGVSCLAGDGLEPKKVDGPPPV